MILPDGTALPGSGLDSVTIIPRGALPRNLIAWFGPWAQILAPVSEELREELKRDGLIAVPLLSFDPRRPASSTSEVVNFGIGWDSQ